MSRRLGAWMRRRGITRVGFELFLVVQLLHLGEHVIQMVQLFVLGWPPPEARGLVSRLDLEKVHFLWNLAVLVALGWLLWRGVRSTWLTATTAWAVLHSSEHGYLLTRALMTGLEGQPGILGARGLLAEWGWTLPGFTTWSRPTVHFFWNLGEVALLALAYAAFLGLRGRRVPARRLAPVALVALLAFVFMPNRGSVQQGPARYVNATDPTCGGNAPCYATIQDAVTAAQPGEAVVVQAGTYVEQVLIQGKNNTPGASEADRIVIQADPAAPLGSVVLDGAANACTNGQAIRLQQSKFITVRGLTITGAGGQAIQLLGGINQNQAIHLERLRIVGNGSPECNGGITIARGNPGTLILNSLIYANGRHGIATIDADGGPHLLIGNTIHGNAWSGVSITRNHETVLANNTITGNGTAAGATGGRFGVTREGSSTPLPAGIRLLHNLLCGNRLGEISGPALDATDAGNLTPTGAEGPGVSARAGCEVTANVYANVAGADALLDTRDDDFTLAEASPAIDRGMDPRTLGLSPGFTPLLVADFAAEAVRPQVGTLNGAALFDVGAREFVLPDTQAPTVTFLQPQAGAFVRQAVTVEARATDDAEVASLVLNADAQALTTALTPAPPAPAVTGTATWNTLTFADGTHTLTATATDTAGNSTSPGATRVVIVDNTPPETRIDTGPTGDLGETSATFTFSGEDNFTGAGSLVFAWRLDGGAFTAFSSATTATVTNLAEGPHTFQVRARDLAGNEDPTPATRTFTVTLGPRISGIDPASAPIGALVTIRGSGFSPGPTSVSFTGVAAVVRSLTSTSLVTTVPPGATPGPVSVTTPRGTATHPFTVLSAQDFSLLVAPVAATLLPGTATTYTVTLLNTGVTAFTGLAALSVSGLPAGVSAAFAPAATLTGGQLGTLTVTAGATAPPGLATLTVTASAATDLGLQTRTDDVLLEIVPGGRTAALGRFTFVNGIPIPDIQLTLGSVTGTTDAAGNFQLLDVPEGTQMLMIDANAAQAGLPIYAVEVALVAGQATQLAPFRITPPPPPERFVPIANANADQVVSDPRFPGFALTLPAGVTITGWDGTLKTRIAIERLAPDALPVPTTPPGLGRSFYQIFFGTPMGGLPSAKLPVTLPNEIELSPGEKAEIWYYDAAPIPGVPAGWRLAGEGTVSEDGTRIVSDPGVGLERFCGVCGLVRCVIPALNAKPSLNPDGARRGEPVDLALGQQILEKTDLVLPGRLPAVVHRTFNPFAAFTGIAGFQLPLGLGWALSIDIALLEESPALRRLVLPGNARFAFVRQPDGTFINTTSPRFAGAVLTQTGGPHTLRFKEGTTWQFAQVPQARGRGNLTGLSMLVEQRDRHGNRLTISRNQFGEVTQMTEPGGRTLTFTLQELSTAIARITDVQDPLGRTVRYGYTSAFQLETVTDPAGGVTRYTYDSAGRIRTITDPRGITFVSHEYDAQGRVIRQTQADGGVWSFAYEGAVGAHSRVTVTDPRGHTTVDRLDHRGFTVETIDALGQATSHERDGAGRVVATTDPLGRTTRFGYDAAGNVTSITDPAGNVRRFAYEPTFNKVASITEPAIPGSPAMVTTFEYNPQGNLIAITDPEQNLRPEAERRKTQITYNEFGQPRTTTNPLGNTTTFTYDGMGNLTSIADPMGNTTTREYDAVSRLTRQRDPGGKPTAFAYDALNRMTIFADSLGGVTRFRYDGNGNLLTVTDARNGVTSHTYDNMDRLETRTDPVGAGESFVYDQAGNLVRHTDRKGQQTTFSYDGLNRRTGASYADGSGTSFTYDAAGRLIQASDSAGGAVLNQYDTLDRFLAQATGVGTITYQYDALGRRTRMEAPGQAPVTYGYDAASRLTAITQASQLVSLAYDPAGRRTRLTLPNGVSTEYQYDPASRLTGLIYRNALGLLGDLTYGYDPAGKRMSVSGSFARTLVPAPVASATYDAANRQTAFGPQALTYDRNGNLTGDGTATYTWDARDRLTAVTGPMPASFVYDGLGRRTGKTINGVTTAFLYDGVDVQTELQADTQVPYLRTLGIDEALSRGASEFYLADALGSTVALTSQDGTVATAYTYAPFGTTVADSSTDLNSFQFTGRENDGTGLYYYRARYYHPGRQRFMGEDPIGFLGGDVNLYAYVGGNPLTFIDPYGLDWIWSQSLGELFYLDNETGILEPRGVGYSGQGAGLNEPGLQHVEDIGPITQGTYDIGSIGTVKTGIGTKLEDAMRLTRRGRDPFNRGGFIIHRGDMVNRTSSKGCIILPDHIRKMIGASWDKTLQVVP